MGTGSAVTWIDHVDGRPEAVFDEHEFDRASFPAHEGVPDRVVWDKVLWKDPATGSYAGVLWVPAGASSTPHVHPNSVHHFHAVSGSCRVGAKPLTRGSYLFVAAGSEHRIEAVGSEGCTILFLTLRTPPSEA